MIVAVGSLYGSPGVSATALALAATWPGEETVLVEANPAGGSLGARFSLSQEPGLASWTAAVRRDAGRDVLREHCQGLPGGLPVMIGPYGAEKAHAMLRTLAAHRDLRPTLAIHPKRTLIVDAGWISPATVALPWVRAADVVLLVLRGEVGDLNAAAARREPLMTMLTEDGRAPLVRLVVINGAGSFNAVQVAYALNMAVAGTMPHDPQTADLLTGRVMTTGARRGDLERRPLLAAAGDIVEALRATSLGPTTAADSVPLLAEVNGHTIRESKEASA